MPRMRANGGPKEHPLCDDPHVSDSIESCRDGTNLGAGTRRMSLQDPSWSGAVTLNGEL